MKIRGTKNEIVESESHSSKREKKNKRKEGKKIQTLKAFELDIRESDYAHSNVSAIGNAHAVVC